MSDIERAREIAYAAHATRIDPAERQDAREVYCKGYRDDEPIVQAALSALSTQQDRVKAMEDAARELIDHAPQFEGADSVRINISHFNALVAALTQGASK